MGRCDDPFATDDRTTAYVTASLEWELIGMLKYIDRIPTDNSAVQSERLTTLEIESCNIKSLH